MNTSMQIRSLAILAAALLLSACDGSHDNNWMAEKALKSRGYTSINLVDTGWSDPCPRHFSLQHDVKFKFSAVSAAGSKATGIVCSFEVDYDYETNTKEIDVIADKAIPNFSIVVVESERLVDRSDS